MSRAKEVYRRHTLLAAEHNGSFCGRVWKDKELIHECEGEGIEHLLIDLRRYVDEALDQRAQNRTASPSEEQYLHAIQKILGNLSDGHIAMLKAHYYSDEKIITATELAAAAGYESYHAATLQYGWIGKNLHEELPVSLPKRPDGSRIYTFALATEAKRSDDEANWKWKLRPEVAFAIERLGLLA